MRTRRRPVKRTDGFIAGLVREVLADLPDGERIERYRLHAACGTYAKRVHGKRNQPQYRMVEEVLALLVEAGEIERIYVPFHLKPDDPSYGKVYYTKGAAK